MCVCVCECYFYKFEMYVARQFDNCNNFFSILYSCKTTRINV